MIAWVAIGISCLSLAITITSFVISEPFRQLIRKINNRKKVRRLIRGRRF